MVDSCVSNILVVDYGGVLGDHHQREKEEELASLLDVSRDECCKLISEKSVQGAKVREDKISEKEFWETVFHIAGTRKIDRLSYSQLTRLWAETYNFNNKIYNLLARVRKKHPIGVLTNIDRGRSRYLIDEVGLLNKIDIYLPSYRFKAIKPKAELWLQATDEIVNKYGRNIKITYIDDRQTHIDACSRFGWNGILFDNTVHLEAQLIDKKLIA